MRLRNNCFFKQKFNCITIWKNELWDAAENDITILKYYTKQIFKNETS